jgi:DNA-binding GntR family transcriptional regulator
METLVEKALKKALLSGSIPPATALREAVLVDIFGISREKIRKILQRLGSQKLIELIPNKGAFVATPSLEQARAIYEARRILEGGIVNHLAPNFDETQTRRLVQHLSDEDMALEQGDRADSVALSAEFHLILAELTGNFLIQQQLQELVAKTSLLVAVHEPTKSAQCACEEHRDIFQALVKRDAAKASKQMTAHLSMIETRLRPGMVNAGKGLDDTLRKIWQEMRCQATIGTI